MTIGIGQGFGLVGAGILAGVALFIWLADRVSRRYGAGEGCLTTTFVSLLMFGCGFLLWLALS
jgi:hypothetical protein